MSMKHSHHITQAGEEVSVKEQKQIQEFIHVYYEKHPTFWIEYLIFQIPPGGSSSTEGKTDHTHREEKPGECVQATKYHRVLLWISK